MYYIRQYYNKIFKFPKKKMHMYNIIKLLDCFYNGFSIDYKILYIIVYKVFDIFCQ